MRIALRIFQLVLMMSVLILLSRSSVSLQSSALAPALGGENDRADRPAERLEGRVAVPPADSLFAQSARQVLHRDFANDDISFLLLDVKSGAVLASQWDHPEKPIPLGSLVKPFVALAYGELHQFKYPTHLCRGTKTGCWRPSGHGPVDLTAAIAYSCNSYFRLLTTNMNAAEVAPVAVRLGLESPASGVSGPALAGLDEPGADDHAVRGRSVDYHSAADHGAEPRRVDRQWLISPLNMAHAYLELMRHRGEPGVGLILTGMARSAREGTGAEVDRALYVTALAKTGTAACTHPNHAPGDGFTIALAPANQPQVLLLVRVHGVPGAQAAKIAGQMLRDIEP
jgi:hypothetical protein